MRIGILISSIGNFGQKGFYNSQEIGLAKMLARDGNDVIVYKLLKKDAAVPSNETNGRMEIRYFPVRKVGNNGLVNTDIIDIDLGKLVYFADTQLSVTRVYKWCQKHNITFIPYIGVIESHSTNAVAKKLIDTLFFRNVGVYNRCISLAKNTDVKEKLVAKGVKHVEIAPVGIDFELLNPNFEMLDRQSAKEELGFEYMDRVVLLVGRIESDRNPMDSVSVFKELKNHDKNFKLLIIGNGSLKAELFALLQQGNLERDVKYIEKIPNSEMWKIYRAAELLITFSRTEIFGMSILEAMYYGTVVHAVNAPGPNDILTKNESGFLYKSAVDMEKSIIINLENSENITRNAHERVLRKFSWSKTAKIVEEY